MCLRTREKFSLGLLRAGPLELCIAEQFKCECWVTEQLEGQSDLVSQKQLSAWAWHCFTPGQFGDPVYETGPQTWYS